jgi:hypothetical protein
VSCSCAAMIPFSFAFSRTLFDVGAGGADGLARETRNSRLINLMNAG